VRGQRPAEKAVAIKPLVRATALSKPEADAVWRALTELSTAIVSGATAPESSRVFVGRRRVRSIQLQVNPRF
jgi:hypothetical protein